MLRTSGSGPPALEDKVRDSGVKEQPPRKVARSSIQFGWQVSYPARSSAHNRFVKVRDALFRYRRHAPNARVHASKGIRRRLLVKISLSLVP